MTPRTKRMLAIALAGLAACSDDESAPEPNLDASLVLSAEAQPADGALDGGALVPGAELVTPAMLDVLFVIDNSGSMASEQVKLAREIPRMVQVLTSGDRWAGRESEVPAGLSEKARRFTPVKSLHLGVVSTNFGGMLEPTGTQEAILSCAGLGDEGKLLSDTTIAVEGVTAKGGEFPNFARGDVVLAPDPACALPVQPRYQSFGADGGQAEVGTAFSCMARVGVRGCPFEQPLESMWNALAPASRKGELYEFAGGAKGQGDRFNDGFVREDAALAVVVLTDEDDCSITDRGHALFGLDEQAREEYGDLNLRCFRNAGDSNLVRAAERYRQGLLSLKPKDPRRVVFTAIAGIPRDAIASGSAPAAILELPEMQYAEDPVAPGLPRIVCSADDATRPEDAYPARRLVNLAGLMQEAALLESICAPSYAPVVDRLVNKIAPLMGE